MQLYIVRYGWDYEPTTLLGVFSTQERAFEAAVKHRQDDLYHPVMSMRWTYSIEPATVDTAYEHYNDDELLIVRER